MTGKSLLIVDDEIENREMLRRHFEFLGYDVTVAENGNYALQRLSEKRFDILITDIMMPEMNGVELLRKVRDDYSMLRRIVMTGYVTLENALACIRYGADSCIFKPIHNISDLERLITDAENRSRYWVEILKGIQDLKVNAN